MNNRISFKARRLLVFIACFFSIAIAVIVFPSAIHHPVVAQTGGLEVVAEFSLEHPPGNIAVTPQG